MKIIVLTFKDTWGFEFLIQNPNESEIYRVVNLDGIATIFRDNQEIWNCDSPDLEKTFKTYLNHRFNYDYKLLDYSTVI